MKLKMFLKDNTEISLEQEPSLSNLTTVFPSWEEAVNTLSKITNENVSEVRVETEDGTLIGQYSDLIILPGLWLMKDDGLYITIALKESGNDQL